MIDTSGLCEYAHPVPTESAHGQVREHMLPLSLIQRLGAKRGKRIRIDVILLIRVGDSSGRFHRSLAHKTSDQKLT